jgi:Tfp pilus assembly protein PilO
MKNKLFSNFSYGNGAALSVLAFFLAAFGLAYFFIMPSLANIQTIKVEIESQGLETEKNYLASKSFDKIEKALKTIEPQLGELEKVFIKKDSALDFVNALEKTASTSQVSETAVLGGETAISESSFQIPLRIESHGNFSEQIDFLSALEAMQYYINIKSLEISAVSHGSAQPKEENIPTVMQISADTYWKN